MPARGGIVSAPGPNSRQAAWRCGAGGQPRREGPALPQAPRVLRAVASGCHSGH